MKNWTAEALMQRAAEVVDTLGDVPAALRETVLDLARAGVVGAAYAAVVERHEASQALGGQEAATSFRGLAYLASQGEERAARRPSLGDPGESKPL